jgi:uncharacterized protein
MCACYSKDPLRMAAFWAVIAGGLNWGLIGLFGFNLIGLILGFFPLLERLAYLLVGVAAIILLVPVKEAHAPSGPPSAPSRPMPPPAPVAPPPPAHHEHAPSVEPPKPPEAPPMPPSSVF